MVKQQFCLEDPKWDCQDGQIEIHQWNGTLVGIEDGIEEEILHFGKRLNITFLHFHPAGTIVE